MPKLLDFLTFREPQLRGPTPAESSDKLRADERDAAVLAGKYPAKSADIESQSELRLASLLQHPHY
jgi:hypothetical protein